MNTLPKCAQLVRPGTGVRLQAVWLLNIVGINFSYCQWLGETKNRKAFRLFLLISIIFFRERDGESVSCGVVGGRRAEGERES